MILKKYILISLALVTFCFPSCAFQKQSKISLEKETVGLSFKEVKKDFPRVEKNLRKWDAPVIADLDQDGFVDILLNDHGLGLQVCWNNKGKFAKPYDIIMGDLHGVTVGDFDKDGNLEMVVSRGGGSGSNARNSKIFRIDKKRNFTALPDFKIPLELMRGRTVKFIDGDNDGDLDLLNFAFPGKEKKGESENYIYKNDGDGQLILATTLPPTARDGQKTLTTDFNGDGIVDILLYGDKKVFAFQGKGDLTYEEVSDKIFPKDIKDVTGIIEFDYDNDGDFDLFFTRGKDFEAGENFYDSNTQTWGFMSKRGRSQFEDLKVGDVLNLQNFQSQWPYNDLYFIGETGYEYEFTGETHSGKDIRLVNSDALGFPDHPDDKGIYIGYVGNQKWRLIIDTWSPSTGVIQGVLEYPETKHSKGLSDILLENKSGKFKDVTQKTNLFLEEHTAAVATADLDNNGFQDLIIIRRGNLIHRNESLVYLNYGQSGFEKINNHNIISTELGAIGMAIETLDYNQDGKVDVVIGNERGKWYLFKNTIPASNENNHLTIQVGDSPSGKASGLGAIVSVKGCKVEQVKRIGATGANYSLSYNNFVHFGLGKCDESVQVKVTWTNGEEAKKTIESGSKKVIVGI